MPLPATVSSYHGSREQQSRDIQITRLLALKGMSLGQIKQKRARSMSAISQMLYERGARPEAVGHGYYHLLAWRHVYNCHGRSYACPATICAMLTIVALGTFPFNAQISVERSNDSDIRCAEYAVYYARAQEEARMKSIHTCSAVALVVAATLLAAVAGATFPTASPPAPVKTKAKTPPGASAAPRTKRKADEMDS